MILNDYGKNMRYNVFHAKEKLPTNGVNVYKRGIKIHDRFPIIKLRIKLNLTLHITNNKYNFLTRHWREKHDAQKIQIETKVKKNWASLRANEMKWKEFNIIFH